MTTYKDELIAICARCEMSTHCRRLGAKCPEFTKLDMRLKTLDTLLKKWEDYKKAKGVK